MIMEKRRLLDWRTRTPTGWPRTKAVAIEFGCGGTPRDRGSDSTGRKSGESRLKAPSAKKATDADLRGQGERGAALATSLDLVYLVHCREQRRPLLRATDPTSLQLRLIQI